MRTKFLFISSLLVFAAVLLAACGGANAAPAPNANSSQNSNAVTSNTTGGTNSSAPASNARQSAEQPAEQPAAPNSNSTAGLQPQTVEGGSVSIQVTPIAFKMGAPLEFDIAMNTHSVDLADDMLKAVVLRDDSGMEYAPTAWDGPAGGGHHREGKIKFAPLTMNTKSLTLVVKNIAGVPERVYKWDVAQ